jgi:rod shape-determining protein MreD
MNNMPVTHLWLMRGVFVVLVMGILFFHLLPLQTAAGGLIWPDFILVFALAWSVRRPDYVPAPLLAAAFLLADLLLQRPPGLWAVLALIACERVKLQSRNLRDATLAAEMISAAAWIVGISLAYRIILAVLLIDVPALGLEVIRVVVTLLAYPLAVVVTHVALGVRKPTPNDIVGKGARL